MSLKKLHEFDQWDSLNLLRLLNPKIVLSFSPKFLRMMGKSCFHHFYKPIYFQPNRDIQSDVNVTNVNYFVQGIFYKNKARNMVEKKWRRDTFFYKLHHEFFFQVSGFLKQISLSSMILLNFLATC